MADILENLYKTRDSILGYYDLADSELNRSYGPGKWPVRHILHHLADAETVLYDRIRRTISRPHQVVWGFDQDAWATALDYTSFPMEVNKGIFASVRAGIIYLASQHYDAKGHYQLVHSRTGLKTLKDLFDKVVWHGQQHIDQIEQALA